MREPVSPFVVHNQHLEDAAMKGFRHGVLAAMQDGPRLQFTPLVAAISLARRPT